MTDQNDVPPGSYSPPSAPAGTPLWPDDWVGGLSNIGRPLWFDKAGNPMDEREAFRLRYDMQPGGGGPVSDYARIGLDEVGDARVSTVWLGLDHGFLPGGPPLIFETMIFGGDYADYCQRYATEAEAAAGHAAVVAALAEGHAPPDWWQETPD